MTTDSPEARSLLARAAAGDAAAFGELAETYRAYLLAVARDELARGLRPKVGPSDVVQDVFVEALRLFGRFQGTEAAEFRGWLRAILLNKVRDTADHYAAGKRAVARERSMDDSGVAGRLRDLVPGDDPSPSAAAAGGEDEARLAAALARLPDDVRRLIVWRTWDGLSFAEIGRRTGRTEDAARMQFARAVERLAAEMPPDAAPDCPR